jgi:hypothetical protein
MPNTPLISEKVDLTSLINGHLERINQLKEELGKLRDMLDGIFASDSTFQMHSSAAKEAAKIRNETKRQILKLPQAADLAARILSLRSQIKERNQELSDYLQDYSRMSGASSFETPDGQVRQIIYVAKLVKIGK